jgi:hypothetical protein
MNEIVPVSTGRETELITTLEEGDAAKERRGTMREMLRLKGSGRNYKPWSNVRSGTEEPEERVILIHYQFCSDEQVKDCYFLRRN